MLTYLHERIDEVLTNGTTEDLAVRIYGPNPATADAVWLVKINHAFDHIPGLADVDVAAYPLEIVPEVDITVNTAAAEKYGLTAGGIRREAAIMVSSEPVAEIPTNGDIYTIAMWSTPQTRENLASLYQLPLDTPSGGHVALGKVASIVIKPQAPSVVYRENGTRADEVDANISGRSLGAVIGAVHAALAKVKMPRGYTTAILGEATERAGSPENPAGVWDRRPAPHFAAAPGRVPELAGIDPRVPHLADGPCRRRNRRLCGPRHDRSARWWVSSLCSALPPRTES